MATPSATSICNRALLRLGEAAIDSIENTDHDTARACALAYDDAVLELLAAHPWNFAVTRQALAKMADAPLYGFAFAFGMPTDPLCLRALDTSLDETWYGAYLWWPPRPSALWQVEMLQPAAEGSTPVSVLVCDEAAVSLRYIASITDPVRFAPWFRRALVAELAAELAYSLESKAEQAADLRQEARRVLNWAKAMDGQEGRAGAYRSRALLDVRY